MKPIREDEFKEYLEYKKFMGEIPGSRSQGQSSSQRSGQLSLDELDMVTAARGDQEFASFLDEMKQRREKEEK